MFQKKLRQYAKLLISTGLNVQKGQTVVITSPVDCSEIVRLCTEEAYRAGCREVVVSWADDFVERQKYLHADDSVFDTFPKRDLWPYSDGLCENACMLVFYTGDPDNMKGVLPERLIRARRAKMAVVHPYYERIYQKTALQCTAAPPTPAWAKKVFPELSEQEAVAALWELIFQASRIDGTASPEKEWAQRIAEMQRQENVLNLLKFKSLHYKNSIGTDLTVGLSPQHVWHSCKSSTKDGISFMQNMPSEEVYTVPLRDHVDGLLVGSIPLVYQGCLIRDFWMRFQNGKVVDFGAKEGEDKLRALMEVDEGAKYLGEIALIPNDSAIRKTGQYFYNPLYDENASCHMALGMGFADCIRGGENMTQNELDKHGLNSSQIHVDFMIGTDDLSIMGTTQEGKEVPIFVTGNFAPEFFA